MSWHSRNPPEKVQSSHLVEGPHTGLTPSPLLTTCLTSCWALWESCQEEVGAGLRCAGVSWELAKAEEGSPGRRESVWESQVTRVGIFRVRETIHVTFFMLRVLAL